MSYFEFLHLKKPAPIVRIDSFSKRLDAVSEQIEAARNDPVELDRLHREFKSILEEWKQVREQSK